MLFWTFILLFAFGVLGLIYVELSYYYHGILTAISYATTILFGAAVSFVATCKQQYEMLVYQCENDIYDNDNDLGKRELIEDIQH